MPSLFKGVSYYSLKKSSLIPEGSREKGESHRWGHYSLWRALLSLLRAGVGSKEESSMENSLSMIKGLLGKVFMSKDPLLGLPWWRRG